MNNQTFYQQTATAIAAYLVQELDIRPGVHWHIRNATSGPRILTLNLSLNPKYAKRIAAMSEALSMAAMLDKSASIRIERGNRGALALEIPKPQGLWFNVSVSHLPRRRGLLASVGIDNEHRPARVNFADPLTPHCLTAGTTGSGKTNVARLLIFDLATQNEPDQIELILMDTRKRGAGWRVFDGIPHLGHEIITDEQTALRVLSWACAEIDRRATSGRTKPHVFVGIDECQDLLDKPEFVKVVGDIAATGREFGIHLLIAMQNPTAKQLGDTSIKRNLTTRLVGRVDSATAAVTCTGQAETGAERLTGAGDFLLVEPMGVKRLTAALLTEKDTQNLPRSETRKSLDLGQYEDVDHVLDQANNKNRADDLDPKQIAVALIAERGITWLTQRLSIGSTKARRVLQFANELRDELIDLDAYTTIPPYQNGISGERNGQKRLYPGMVVCQGEE